MSNSKSPQNPLSACQTRFVDAYIETLDPVKSAEIAGYSKIGLKSRATELLRNPQIQKTISERLEQVPATLKINRAFILKKLFDIVAAASATEQTFDKQGNPTGTKIKDAGAALRALEALSRCYTRVTDAQAPHSDDLRVMYIENLDETKL